MQELRDSKEFDFIKVCSVLHNFVSLRGYKTLQFSFATKMANTIDENLPIYDSEVASMFGFRAPYNYKAFDIRLSEYLEFYEKLKSDYDEFQKSDEVQHVFHSIESVFPNMKKMSVIKKLDFIIWSAGKLKSSNQLIVA